MVWLGRRAGGLWYWFSRRARAVGIENLRRALPERRDHHRILRRSMRQQGLALADALWAARLTPETAARYLEAEPEDDRAFRALLARGRGLVIATAHFGSWEMLNLAGGAWGGLPRATFIARPVRNPWIDRHLRLRRERGGNRLVYRDEALPACIGALRRGEIVCSVIDMVVEPKEGGLFVDFFETPALTSGALALLALRRGAPLVFMACRPLEDGRRYRIEFEEIPVDAAAADREAEVLRLTRELSRALERLVRAHPEAWIWNYKRWRARPSELPGDYPGYALWVHPHW